MNQHTVLRTWYGMARDGISQQRQPQYSDKDHRVIAMALATAIVIATALAIPRTLVATA